MGSCKLMYQGQDAFPTTNKKLLGAPGLTTRSKDATITRSKDVI